MRPDASIHWFPLRAETEKFFQGVADAYYEEGLRRGETATGGAPASKSSFSAPSNIAISRRTVKRRLWRRSTQSSQNSYQERADAARILAALYP